MKRRHLISAAAVSLVAPSAQALMAGIAPDSPLARLDGPRADSPFACVASLMGEGCYSAVCIGPRHALTAAHVAAKAASLFLVLHLSRDFSHRFAIRRSATPPAPPPSLRDPAHPVGDLALIEIEGEFPAGLTFPPLARTPAAPGLRIELAGYGASGPGDRGGTVARNPALRRTGANRIDAVWPANAAQGEPMLYEFTFDAPGRRAGASLGNRLETGLAPGDSGGPAFVREGGRLALLGINSHVRRRADGVDHGFGTVGGGQLLAAHRAWLGSVLGPAAWPGLL
jgi:Trypsin-like peptidase domain